ncbi:unnamed protein product [Ilex paraguariensis]|uniref:Uncharacterized protein n=1 Tax=Ilex paraguariensis TaxID=185542 RepID=A0ABC8TK03_9AQUA
MDFGYGGNGSPDDHEETSHSLEGKKNYHRHSAQQIQQLEAFFKECPHPDENQRRRLSMELGLDTKQIKFWFQNKRTQTKAQNERADNSSLRTENERIHCENLAIVEALKSVICPACGGPPFREEDRQHGLQKLMMENARLKEEHARVSNILASFMGKPFTEIQSLSPSPGYSSDLLAQAFSGQATEGSSHLTHSKDTISAYQLSGIQEMEKTLMIETVTSAMDELVKLLRVNAPVWVKSPADQGRCALHRDSYDKLFPKANHFRTTSARIESSKDTIMVEMAAIHLVEMFLDSDKWVDLFPTIVTKARTLEAIDTGDLGGSLQLMYEQMHILSPLVAPREFFFLRYCRQLDSSIWVVVDVSYDFKETENSSSTLSWRLPSGCMIQDMSNGKSKVTWIEHVQVDDRSLTHRLYRDLVCVCQAYGAKRWVATLQRMCERFAYSMGSRTSPCHELEGVIDAPEGRRRIVNLSHRMVKNFCSSLSMSNKLDFPHLSESNNSGIRVSVRKSNEPGQPRGMIVAAATSLWLPFSCETLFDFFINQKIRAQWDVLSNGNPVAEIAHISCGTRTGNCISIIQPFVPKQNMLMLQESCIDPSGALVVYAPIDLPAITEVISGEDTGKIPILPSGIIISSDGRLDKGSKASTSTSIGKPGSLVTVAFQILVCCNSLSKQLNMESVATVNTLISSTVQKIKEALDCSDLD